VGGTLNDGPAPPAPRAPPFLSNLLSFLSSATRSLNLARSAPAFVLLSDWTARNPKSGKKRDSFARIFAPKSDAVSTPSSCAHISTLYPRPALKNMASLTASSVAARAVAGRSVFLKGSSRVAAVAPKSAAKARVVVRAADEVRD